MNAAPLFTGSVRAGGTVSSIAAFHDWWAGRQVANVFEVTPTNFADLDGWYFDPDTGNLRHESGRFFTVEGMRVQNVDGVSWSQPIINQPEIGILGILVKEFDGVPHCLMQAKMEPGNVNVLQLSPTVQATRSNYTRVHRGNAIRYLEYFEGPTRGKVFADALHSEQGTWFWHKHNRNMIVEVTDEVPEHEDFRWLTFDQLRQLLQVDDLVNMDARSALACLPLSPSLGLVRAPEDPFDEALLRSYEFGEGGADSLHTQSEILSWFTDAKAHSDWQARLIPLGAVENWARAAGEIVDHEGERFRVIGVRVKAANREVTGWAQPLLAPRRQGLAAFLARPVKGVLHLLVRARAEAGLLDMVEMAPTVQVPPAGDASAISGDERYLPQVLSADPARIRFDAVLSEEGGRFHHAQTRYQVIEVGEDFPIETPEQYRWLTVRQLMTLLHHGHYVNVEARSLLACVHSLAMG
jgi:oxidase EvaA